MDMFDTFFDDWKDDLNEYYGDLLPDFNAARNNHNPLTDEEWKYYNEYCCNVFKDNRNNFYHMQIFLYQHFKRDYDVHKAFEAGHRFEEKIGKVIDQKIYVKKRRMLKTIEKRVGKIVDSELKIVNGGILKKGRKLVGSINGENDSMKVQIYNAGDMKIDRHYRVKMIAI